MTNSQLSAVKARVTRLHDECVTQGDHDGAVAAEVLERVMIWIDEAATDG